MSLLLDVIRQATDNHDHDHESHSDHADHDTHTEAGSFCSGGACLRNWKIGFAAILFVEGLIFGYFALVLNRFACLSTKRFRKFLSFVNIGGGGIFLASGFLHVIPEAVAFLAPSEEEGGHEGHDDHGDGHEGHAHGGFPTAMGVILLTFLAFMYLEMFLFPHHHGDEHEHEQEDKVLVEEGKTEGEAEEEVEKSQVRNGLKSKPFLSMTLMTIMIGIHSVFESVALGASSRWSSTLNVFLAIATHRWATTMALGARYASSNLSALCYGILVVGFAAIAPVGIAIGAALQGVTNNTVNGVVFAISGGIFLYVGGFETPVEELVGRQENKFFKFLTYVAGAGIIAIITVILSATGVH